MNYIFLISGILIFDLLRLNSEKGKADFTWRKFLTENGIPSLIAAILGVSLILGNGVKQEFVEITVGLMTLFIPIYLLIGICADVIIKKIFATFNPDAKTIIGVNAIDDNDPIDPPPGDKG